MSRLRAGLRAGVIGILGVAIGLTVWARPDLIRQAIDRVQGPEVVTVKAEVSEVAEEAIREMIDDGWCSTHDRPEETCPECPPESRGAPRVCLEELPVIRFEDPRVAARAGLETTKVVSSVHADTIMGNARIDYDEHAYAEVRPRVRGLIHEVLVDHGNQVEKGDLLVVFDSAEVGTAKAQYLAALPTVELARATLERTRLLTQSEALPRKEELVAQTELNRAQADLLNASQTLRNLGFTDSDLARIAGEQDTSTLWPITSPIAGTVVEKHAVPGEAVEATEMIVVISDIRQMWAYIDVYEDQIQKVRPGQAVTFSTLDPATEPFPGSVEFIDTAVNPATRTIQVRAYVANPEMSLRAHQFGQARIAVGEPRTVVVIPRSAIQKHETADMVFLVQPDGSYRPQRIEVETDTESSTEAFVSWGLSEGQEIVTTGSFVLKSELRRDELEGE